MSGREAVQVSKRAFVATVLTLVVPSLLSVAFAESGFFGVKNEAVAEQAVSRTSEFLWRVGAHMGLVMLSEMALVWAASFGVATLFYWFHGRARGPFFRWIGEIGTCALVTASYWGMIANRSPGLFLETLSGSRLLQAWIHVAWLVAPVLAVAAVAGSLLWVLKGTRGPRVALTVVAGLIAFVVGLNTWRVRTRLVIAPYLYPDRTLPKPVEAPSAHKRPSILWIAVDSLRPDKIDPVHTPTLAALVARSVYYPNSLVTQPRTGPSWIAQMTSLEPMSNGVETMFPTEAAGRLSQVALPAHLGSLGYRTVVASEYAGEFFGRVNLGFQIQCVPKVELAEIMGQMLLSRAPLVLAHAGAIYRLGPDERSWLGDPIGSLIRGMANFSHPKVIDDDLLAVLDQDTRDGVTSPFFALLFYSQPHFPYTSNAPFYDRYAVPGASHEIRYGRDVSNEVVIERDADRRQLEGLYRGALAETDAAIARLFERLQRRGKLADTIVVLTSDHGEGLYECSTCLGHGDNLRGVGTLRVPLAFALPAARFPDAKPGTVEEAWVSQLDIYPTILRLLGEPQIVTHEGVPLLASTGLQRPPLPRTFTAETGEWLWTTNAVPKNRMEYPFITGLARLEKGRIEIDPKYDPVIRASKHRAALRWPYKLDYEPSSDGVAWRLFKLDDDPFQDRDVAAQYPREAADLKAALRKAVLRHPNVLAVGDYFITRPPMPPEEEW